MIQTKYTKFSVADALSSVSPNRKKRCEFKLATFSKPHIQTHFVRHDSCRYHVETLKYSLAGAGVSLQLLAFTEAPQSKQKDNDQEFIQTLCLKKKARQGHKEGYDWCSKNLQKANTIKKGEWNPNSNMTIVVIKS